jgi:DNA-binding transcriptional LysR family regulator
MSIMSSVHDSGIEMNLLLALDALFEERHVTRAAARLGITQSAMSHALSRLRALFADPLFVRTPRAMIPTPRAHEIVEPVRRALREIDGALTRRPAFDPNTARRVFRIGAGDYGELAVLPGLSARVQREAPGVDLVVQPLPKDVAVSLEAGVFDVAIGPGAQTWPSILCQRLFTDRLVCLVREGHPVVKRALSLDVYLALSHALVTPRGTGRAYIDEVLAGRGLERRVAVKVPHFLIAPFVVASTDVVLTVPERIARAVMPALALRVLECPLELEDVQFHQLWHERVHNDPAHAWLRAAIAASVDHGKSANGRAAARARRSPARARADGRAS